MRNSELLISPIAVRKTKDGCTLYYAFRCVDCGKEHVTQKVRGFPRNPRCASCAARRHLLGRNVSEETRIKISQSLMGHPVSEKVRQNHRPLTIEQKLKIAEVNKGNTYRKGKKASAETIEKMRVVAREMWNRPGMRERMSQINKGDNHNRGLKRSSEARHNMSIARKGRPLSEKALADLRKYHSSLEYRVKASAHLRAVSPHRFNNKERKLCAILDELFPNQYKYNGCGELGFMIYSHTPDFVNIDGQKKIIEFNGCAWHCCEQCGITRHPAGLSTEYIRNNDKVKIAEAEQLGYKVLVIWEHDMMDKQKLTDKLLSFNVDVS